MEPHLAGGALNPSVDSLAAIICVFDLATRTTPFTISILVQRMPNALPIQTDRASVSLDRCYRYISRDMLAHLANKHAAAAFVLLNRLIYETEFKVSTRRFIFDESIPVA